MTSHTPDNPSPGQHPPDEVLLAAATGDQVDDPARAHIARCAHCSEQVGAARAGAGLSAGVPGPDAATSARIDAAVHDELARIRASRRRVWRITPPRLAIAGAAAAVLVGAVVAGGVLPLDDPAEDSQIIAEAGAPAQDEAAEAAKSPPDADARTLTSPEGLSADSTPIELRPRIEPHCAQAGLTLPDAPRGRFWGLPERWWAPLLGCE